jgi:hypothetical protein
MKQKDNELLVPPFHFHFRKTQPNYSEALVIIIQTKEQEPATCGHGNE